MEQTPLVFIVGPTAVGKSAIGLEVACRLDAEIISCDALQVYREIVIASDKDPAIIGKIPHHLIDVVSVKEDFNVARYRQMALAAIENIRVKGRIPLIVGGSGMYMSVLLDGIFEETLADDKIKKELIAESRSRGTEPLYQRLKELDPASAVKLHPHDSQRIIRALEVVLSCGQPLSQLRSQRQGLWGKVPIKVFALNRPRAELYRRVEARIDDMFEKGLVEEVSRVSALGLSRTACKVIGIPELTGYLNGSYDLERAKYLMKLNTRHYVKRQLTWFRRDKRLIWIDIASDQPPQQVAKAIVANISLGE